MKRCGRARESNASSQMYAALPAQVYEVKARPDFEKYRELLIGTHDGVYVLTDSKTPTVSRWSGWQIIHNKLSTHKPRS